MNKESITAVTLRRAAVADMAVIIALHKKAESRTYSADTSKLGTLWNILRNVVYLIEVNGHIVGKISYQKKSDGVIYLSGLIIDSPYQGRGFSKVAVKKILEEVKGASRIWLVTHPDNSRAMRLYQSLGFRVIERKEDYYGDGEPRNILELKN